MSTILAVDLAAKYSAACLLCDGEVIDQFDSWGRTESGFISAITDPWCGGQSTVDPPPDVLVVEDLPQRLPYMTVVKHVCRLQGRIIDRMTVLGWQQALLFVPPHEWRKTYDGLGRGTGPDAVVPVAADLGYTPPDLTKRITGRGDKALARKVATDYCAAYLIAAWAQSTMDTHGTFDHGAVARYGEPRLAA